MIRKLALVMFLKTARLTIFVVKRYRRRRYRRSRGNGRNKNRLQQIGQDNIKSDIDSFKICTTNMFNTLKSYDYKGIDSLFTLSQNNSGLIYNVCSSFCSAFHKKYKQNDNSSGTQREHINFHFNCKFIDELNLKSIIHDSSIVKLLPDSIRKLCPLRLFYKYNNLLSLHICNYKYFLKHLTFDKLK